jgi:hypothetical protein
MVFAVTLVQSRLLPLNQGYGKWCARSFARGPRYSRKTLYSLSRGIGLTTVCQVSRVGAVANSNLVSPCLAKLLELNHLFQFYGNRILERGTSREY